MGIKEKMIVSWKDYEYLLGEIKILQNRIGELESRPDNRRPTLKCPCLDCRKRRGET